MKHTSLFAVLALFLAIAFGPAAYSPTKVTGSVEDYPGAMEFDGPSLDAENPSKTYNLDTLGNTDDIVIDVPTTFISRHIASFHLTLRHLSGTRAMKVYLEEANKYSAVGSTAGWVKVDSLAPTATVNEYLIRRDETYGTRQRIRIKGNASTTQQEEFLLTSRHKMCK